jgi:23S rRNA (cytosine1962-C5)-methyltransferase
MKNRANRKQNRQSRHGDAAVSGDVRKSQRPSTKQNAAPPTPQTERAPENPRRRFREPARSRLSETIGVLLEAAPDRDYALLDSGEGLKLERYGKLKLIRPEGQAMWRRELPQSAWEGVDAVFTGDTDEEGLGRWHFPKQSLGETFPMAWQGLSYLGRFTSFRHTGVFPEQAAHWRFLETRLEKSIERGELPKVLNLFGYTGLASLVAARAGAAVTHVDASRKAIGWARENQSVAELGDRPVRWICEDAVKYCEREIRRGNTYEGILLDPPAYGRGPKGEVWQFFEDVPYMLDLCRELMSSKPLFTVLTAYTIRASSLAIHELMQEVYGDLPGRIETGELALRTENSDRRISTSMFSRWIAE